MIRKQGFQHGILLLALVLAILFSASACKSMNFENGGSSGSVAPSPPEPSPVYYDFDDVLIPQELKLDKDNCFVYRASGISAGVLVLTGRVEVNSLVAFFENNMIKDNWALVSVVRTPRTLMLFRKENRTCVITIRGTSITTNLEVWVAPGSEMAPGAGLLKESGLAE
ncbi:hypothetical protein SAMN02745216_01971 [Desulfatibacillum alkenivorans DSM 16219]|jgi:hypothetical protein|uniref:Lipoprotein n=1 Tax=Desulfatibacillum alkenivorans DSM 16219 TaxID=1121393 RepID=A0A1M6KQV2_9BACT|nr:hypothetical protein [Desulfatibacillum alkenivorans]SHJ61315.1 hypothetical protein SAMN02745216_01971 [Desulfatibacillum alkenivorans DSM 16219]